MRDWLTARPIAHRGLHDQAAGIIENTPSAFRAAIEGGYGIECDLQISADGEAMVHHDDALGRLNDGSARLDAMTAAALQRVAFKATSDRMLTLGELCDLVAGRTTLVIELKSTFAGDDRTRGPNRRRAGRLWRAGRGDVVRSRPDGRGQSGSRARAARCWPGRPCGAIPDASPARKCRRCATSGRRCAAAPAVPGLSGGRT